MQENECLSLILTKTRYYGLQHKVGALDKEVKRHDSEDEDHVTGGR